MVVKSHDMYLSHLQESWLPAMCLLLSWWGLSVKMVVPSHIAVIYSKVNPFGIYPFKIIYV